MRTIAAHALDLDVALRQFDAAAASLQSTRGKRARRRVHDCSDAVRAAACRLVVVEAASGLDVTPAATKAALADLLEKIVQTGALAWIDVVEVVNSVGDGNGRRAES